MSLDHILLGMLDDPASGYDLGRMFDESARMFWFAELSQIYPTLRRLEAKGFLVSREAPSTRGPKRRVYERTPAGEGELHEWLRARPQLKTQRLSYVAQLYFLGQLDDAAQSRRFFEALRDELRAQVAQFRAIEERVQAECLSAEESDLREFHHQAALRAGMFVTKARLEWCDVMLDLLEHRQAPLGEVPDNSDETASNLAGSL